MAPEWVAMGQAAAAAKAWRWLPGCKWVVIRAAPLEDYSGRIDEMGRLPPDGAIPDLLDECTLGALVAVVRSAWSDPLFYAYCGDVKIKGTDLYGWDFLGRLHGKSCRGMMYRSEQHALLGALLATEER